MSAFSLAGGASASTTEPAVVVSRDTLRLLGMADDGDKVGPLMVQIKDPTRAVQVRDDLHNLSCKSFKRGLVEICVVTALVIVIGIVVVVVCVATSVVVLVAIGSLCADSLVERIDVASAETERCQAFGELLRRHSALRSLLAQERRRLQDRFDFGHAAAVQLVARRRALGQCSE